MTASESFTGTAEVPLGTHGRILIETFPGDGDGDSDADGAGAGGTGGGVPGRPDDFSETPVSSRALSLDAVTDSLGEFARRVTDGFRSARPQRVTVEFGCRFTLREGQLVAVVTRGGVEASLRVVLEWEQPGAG